uniref:Uncharacterized protein n=1 Tax=Anopheles darlingi TaxID=43151 RepID=A0A2M4D8X9_ANODA
MFVVFCCCLCGWFCFFCGCVSVSGPRWLVFCLLGFCLARLLCVTRFLKHCRIFAAASQFSYRVSFSFHFS